MKEKIFKCQNMQINLIHALKCIIHSYEDQEVEIMILKIRTMLVLEKWELTGGHKMSLFGVMEICHILIDVVVS